MRPGRLERFCDDREAVVISEDAAITMEFGQKVSEAGSAGSFDRVHDPPGESKPSAGHLDAICERE
jgi:hypothetical protein